MVLINLLPVGAVQAAAQRGYARRSAARRRKRRTLEERRAHAAWMKVYVSGPGKALHEARVAQRRALLDQLKAKPCKDCGNSYPPECMDFDHRDPTTKAGQVSDLVHCKLERLHAEIAKCDLVCANCHRIRTHRGIRVVRSA